MEINKIPFHKISEIPGEYINIGEIGMFYDTPTKKQLVLNWIKENNPQGYSLIKENNPELFTHGLGATTTTNKPWYAGILQTLTSAIPAGLQTWQQVQLTKAQVQRAEQGQPPINIPKYVQSSMPTATVSVGVQPSTQKTIMYIAGGGALLLMLMMLNKKGAK